MRFRRFLLLAACVAAWSRAVSAGEAEAIAKDDLDVVLATDKASYYRGEPVMLLLKLVNKTDRELVMSRQDSLLSCISLIGGPYRVWEEAKDEHGNTLYEVVTLAGDPTEHKVAKSVYVTNEYDGFNVPRTMYGKALLERPWDGVTEIRLPPHGEHTWMIPLNALFDLNCPMGWMTEKQAPFLVELDYPVWKDSPQTPWFTVKRVATFVVHRPNLSSSRAVDDSLERVFGKARAVDLLCDEAEAILRTMREQPEEQDEESAEYRRLMVILESLPRLSRTSTHMWELRNDNRTSLDDFEKWVGSIRESNRRAR